ncbi:hypothetical protein CFC21_049356, partial [Triticum aestivum]
GAASC